MTRLARIALNARDVEALAAFYVDVLGFERIASSSGTVSLRLGATPLDLVAVDGRPCPSDVAGWNPQFQHCAIVVADMARAMQALHGSSSWAPISVDGPETLPPNTGGVTAFKFRDPEGHPLELLAFPDAPVDASTAFVRVDHSALSVADVDRSIAFYEDLGLIVAMRSLNSGVEQERLDAVPGATVDVVALQIPGHAKPHVELLGYRGHDDRPAAPAAADDVAATRLVFAVSSAAALGRLAGEHWRDIVAANPASLLMRDPDGHLLAFVVETTTATQPSP